MLSLHDPASRAEALRSPLAPELRRLIGAHLELAEANDLLDQTHIAVIQADDPEDAIIDAIGFSPLVDPISGARFGTSAFNPYWGWLQEIDGWYEMIVIQGNAGFAYILLIEDSEGVLPDLIKLCRTYCRDGQL